MIALVGIRRLGDAACASRSSTWACSAIRTYSAVNAATLTFGIAFAMMFFAFFFYMGNVWHYSQARAGLAIAPGPLTVIPVAILTGRLAGRFGHRPFLVGGALLYAAAGAVVPARAGRPSRRTCRTGCPACS